MTQTLPKLVTFEQFIEWYPSNGVRYELHQGVIVEMPPPTGEHENVVGFLAAQITFQFLQMGLPFRIPKTAFVKIQSHNSTYSPDILLLNHDNLVNEPLWSKQSTVMQAASIPLAVEVVSTNWRCRIQGHARRPDRVFLFGVCPRCGWVWETPREDQNRMPFLMDHTVTLDLRDAGLREQVSMRVRDVLLRPDVVATDDLDLVAAAVVDDLFTYLRDVRSVRT
jgi:hypothetical protein